MDSSFFISLASLQTNKKWGKGKVIYRCVFYYWRTSFFRLVHMICNISIHFYKLQIVESDYGITAGEKLFSLAFIASFDFNEYSNVKKRNTCGGSHLKSLICTVPQLNKLQVVFTYKLFHQKILIFKRN